MKRLERPLVLLVALAALQVAAGLVLTLAGAGRGGAGFATGPPPWIRVLQLLAFGASGAWLALGARDDARPARLGAVFLLIATSYAHVPLRATAATGGSLAAFAGLLSALRLDAFLPLSVWLFVRDFPRALSSRRTAAVVRVGVRVSGALGLTLWFANAVLALELLRPEVAALGESLDARRFDTAYWAITYGLTGAALPWIAVKTSSAPHSERRRVRLFTAALLVGALPPALAVLGGALSASVAEVFRGPSGRSFWIPLLQIPIASIPIASAYAVLVQRVMEVRLLLRSALRYTLARSTLIAATALPFLLLAWEIYRARHLPLVEVVSGAQALAALGTGGVALVALRLHRPALDALDRWFFRDQYDARRILLDLSGAIRDARSLGDLAERLSREVDRALHVDAIDLLVLDPAARELRSPRGRARPLGADSRIVALVEQAKGPLDVDLERSAPARGWLPEAERGWLADSGFRQLVPLLGTGGELLGLLCLGAKRSELAYTREDAALLGAVCASGSLALENRLIRAGAVAFAAADDALAMECARCGLLWPAKLERCAGCSHELEPSSLPRELLGKFVLERRIGAGGMGVVFLALDTSLQRYVAIKTLPRLSPEAALALRREARAMASVTHPHLALIFGAEAWRGTPLLVLEYLAGGTLVDRLGGGPLALEESLDLGLALAHVLDRVHAAGILHRDIKPSNVGYTETGIPKLLDFGLARLLATAAPAAGTWRDGIDSASTPRRQTSASSGLVGTPLYLSPEAIWGGEPDPSFDLWSTCVLLYEALAGRHPFERSGEADTLYAITRGRPADLREHVPRAPEAVARFFSDALAPERSRRPATARELAARLEALR